MVFVVDMTMAMWCDYPVNKWVGIKTYDANMPEVNQAINDAYRKANDAFKSESPDHLVYGVKLYDRDDVLKEVQLCANPMSDDAFYKATETPYKNPYGGGMMVLAIHKKR